MDYIRIQYEAYIRLRKSQNNNDIYTFVKR